MSSIPEESTMEEGLPTTTDIETDSNDSSIKDKRSKTTKKRLSTISKMYDIDGDGVLDEAEQAMRDMDTSGKGHLTNDKVYAMMKKQLELQKEMFNMKRVVLGLSIFALILAISNLGTAWAAAVLAKDTSEHNGYLMDRAGENTLRTKNDQTNYNIDGTTTNDDSRRNLDETFANNAQIPKTTVVTMTGEPAAFRITKSFTTGTKVYTVTYVGSQGYSGGNTLYRFSSSSPPNQYVNFLCPNSNSPSATCELEDLTSPTGYVTACPQFLPDGNSQCDTPNQFCQYDADQREDCSGNVIDYWIHDATCNGENRWDVIAMSGEGRRLSAIPCTDPPTTAPPTKE